MGARVVWVAIGWTVLVGYAGGCDSEPDSSSGKGGTAAYEVDDEGCPLTSWEALNQTPCEDERVSCHAGGVCFDDEDLTLYATLSCRGGVWRYSHSDDECCPPSYEDYIEVEGEDCSYVGEGVSCTAP